MKRIWGLLLAVVLLLSLLPAPGAFALDAPEIVSGGTLGGSGVVSAAETQLAPGVLETVFTLNTADGKAQNQFHMLTVDPSEPTVSLRATCPENEAPFPWALRRTSEQAAALEASLRRTDPAATVVGGVNANYYNMNTGEPRGAVVCGGEIRHNTQSGNQYFYIKADGACGVRSGGSKIPAGTQEAVGGYTFILRKGKLVENDFEYAATRNPRTVLGLRPDGTILLLQTDGRQSPTSVGMTLDQIGEVLLALGCTDALNLDGGGSSTFLSRRSGEALTVKNSPSDGVERAVSAGLMVVSTAPIQAAAAAPCAHDWALDGGQIICAFCGETRSADTFTGLYRDGEAQRCRIAGSTPSGWIAWGDSLLHLGAGGEVHSVTVRDHRTCTENGALSAVCETCGATYTGSARYRTGHHWDENHVCTVCGTVGTPLSALETTGVSAQYLYRGVSVCPYPKFTDNGYALEIKTGVNGRDGAAMWYGADTLGPAMVEVEGRGDYYGRVTMTYSIALAPVSGAEVSHAEGTRLWLSWQEVPGAQEYCVYRREGTDERLLARAAAPADGLLLENLTPDTSYTLCVRAAAESDGVRYESAGQTWLSAATTRDPDGENSPSAKAIKRVSVTLPDAAIPTQRSALGPTLFLPAFADLSALPLVIETASGASVTLTGVRGSVRYTPGKPVDCAALIGASQSGAGWLDVSVDGQAPWRVWLVQGCRTSLFLSGADGFTLRTTGGKLRCSEKVGGMTTLTGSPKRSASFTLPAAKSLYSDAPECRVWRLDAMADDPTLLENKLFYKLGVRLEMPGAPTAAWVDVYQDGAYCGLYQLCPALPRAEGAEVDAVCAALRRGDAGGLDLDALARAWLLLQYRDDDRALAFYRDESGALCPAPDWIGDLQPDESLLAALPRIPGLKARADELRESWLRPAAEKLLRSGGTMDTYIDRAVQSAVMDRLLRPAGEGAWAESVWRGEAEMLRADLLLRLDPTAERRNPFHDVPAGQYYHDPVLWAVRHQPRITNGTSATTFSPNAPCTRAQAVTFLWRANGCMEPRTTANPFRDVKSTDYFYKAVLWAAEQGITDGTSADTFSPNAACTRAHVVTFLWRASGKSAAGGTNPFRDVSANAYYFQPVLWAVSSGVTDGVTQTTFAPGQTCTRGQIVTFLYRAR